MYINELNFITLNNTRKFFNFLKDRKKSEGFIGLTDKYT